MITGVSLNVTVAQILGGPDSAKSFLTSLLMSSGIRSESTPLPLFTRGRVSVFSGSRLPSLDSSSTTFLLLLLLPLLFLLLPITSGRFLVELRKVTR